MKWGMGLGSQKVKGPGQSPVELRQKLVVEENSWAPYASSFGLDTYPAWYLLGLSLLWR
jgi:hypothetical protein